MAWLFGKPSKRAKGSLPAVLLDESISGSDRGRKSMPGSAISPQSSSYLKEGKDERKGRGRVATLEDSGSYLEPTTPMNKTRGGKSKASTLHAVEEHKDAKLRPRSKTHEGHLEEMLTVRGATDLSLDETKTRPSSSAALSTSLLAKALRRNPKGDEVEKIADEVADVKVERVRTEKVDVATDLEAVKDPAASHARLLLNDGMKAVAEDSDAVSKQLQRRQEAFLRSKRLKEMMCTSPAIAMPSEEVDINNLSGQQQSSEDMYWQSLWKATKDLMHESSEEDRGDFDGLLPGVPGSVELRPML